MSLAREAKDIDCVLGKGLCVIVKEARDGETLTREVRNSVSLTQEGKDSAIGKEARDIDCDVDKGGKGQYVIVKGGKE